MSQIFGLLGSPKTLVLEAGSLCSKKASWINGVLSKATTLNKTTLSGI